MPNSTTASTTIEIPRKYLPRIKFDLLAILGYFALALLLFVFGYQFWALIPFLFFLVFTIQVIRGFKDHQLLLEWLDNNSKTKIFIYSSKLKHLSFIEDEILPSLKHKVLVSKNDKGNISGDLPSHIYYQLYALLKFKALPVVITINNGMLGQSSYKGSFDQFANNEIAKTKLEEVVLRDVNWA